ncbi:MAG: hypothetical protein U0694_04000 [Anaerolineae bacterium]
MNTRQEAAVAEGEGEHAAAHETWADRLAATQPRLSSAAGA